MVVGAVSRTHHSFYDACKFAPLYPDILVPQARLVGDEAFHQGDAALVASQS